MLIVKGSDEEEWYWESGQPIGPESWGQGKGSSQPDNDLDEPILWLYTGEPGDESKPSLHDGGAEHEKRYICQQQSK